MIWSVKVVLLGPLPVSWGDVSMFEDAWRELKAKLQPTRPMVVLSIKVVGDTADFAVRQALKTVQEAQSDSGKLLPDDFEVDQVTVRELKKVPE